MIESFMLTPQVSMIIGKQQQHHQHQRPQKLATASRLWMSDVPQEDKVNNKKSQKKAGTVKRDEEWLERRRRNNKIKHNWLPEPPEDQLTLVGDIASLFLYAFMDHFFSHFYLSSLLASSTSAADAAHTLDPTGSMLLLQATPVWLDSIALGPHTVDQVLFMDLESKVMPHFTTLLDSAGLASVSLVSCWLVAGLYHRAFHFRNTLDCSTHRAIAVAGQTWTTACLLLVLITCVSQHMVMDATTDNVSTLVLMTEGRILSPVEEWFLVLSRADCDYIFDSLGVVLTWRFLLSLLLGGWNKKD